MEELLGRKLYEEFKTVVQLKEQVQVTDTEWLDLLQHVHHGNCRSHRIELLQSLIITNSMCPPIDFTQPPWKDVVLVTPRHTVCCHWNKVMLQTKCRQNHSQLFICTTYDTCNGQPLTLAEKFAVATKPSGQKGRCNERAALPGCVELVVGMKVMVTINVKTDLDVANGSHGEITKIVLDEHESAFDPTSLVVILDYPPAYILVKLSRTKATQLEGLEKDVLPLMPLEHTFTIHLGRKEETVTRWQLPLTAAYTFTDYHSQGQTICPVIVDIGTPPTGGLTPFNVYVALSQG